MGAKLTWREKRFQNRFGDCSHSDLTLTRDGTEIGVVSMACRGLWNALTPTLTARGNPSYRSLGVYHTKSEAKKALRLHVESAINPA